MSDPRKDPARDARPPANGVPWARSLPVRVGLLAALVVATVIAVGVLAALWIGNRVAERAAASAVERAASVQEAFEERALAQLELMAQVFVSDPALAAYLARAEELGDRASMLDLLAERQDDLGYDFAIVLDADGTLIVRTDDPGATAVDLSAEPLVAAAIDEYGAYGLWTERGGLYNVAVVPVVIDYVLQGFLALGFALDESTALELRRVSGAEVVLLVGSPEGIDVVVSTLEPAATRELDDALRNVGEATGPRVVTLGGRRFAVATRPLIGTAASVGHGAAVGTEERAFSVALAPLDPEVAPFRTLGRAILVGGLLGTLLTSVLLLVFTQRALAPVARLSKIAQQAAEGDYGQSVEVERDDEVGQLARAFDRLLSDLRERRDTEAYLAQLSWSVPEGEALASRAAARPPSAPQPEGDSMAPTVVLGDEAPEPPTGEGTPGASTGAVIADRFEILATLGSGGMGVVYKALDRSLGEVVALKTVRPEVAESSWLARLKDELRLARKVTHPNVLRTYDFGEVDGQPFITMEYVRGVTLRYLLARSGRLPYSAALRLARELCRGLAAAHEQGVLHRDIKPENLLIEPNGNAKLMDFGIARPVVRAETGETRPGAVIGTPEYLAPELLAGAEATVASDLYACGVVFYELFTGALPFQQEIAAARLAAKLRDDPVPPSESWPGIPPELETIILRCLAREPDDRYPSAEALLAALEPLRA